MKQKDRKTSYQCPCIMILRIIESPFFYNNFARNAIVFQALALIEMFNAPEGRYKQDVYLLPKKMGKSKSFFISDCLSPIQC